VVLNHGEEHIDIPIDGGSAAVSKACEDIKRHVEASVRKVASTDRILNAVLDLMQKDPHHFSARPCSTCQCVSAIAGRDFGCVLKAKEKVAP